jgi:hypothetical protein
MIYALTRSSVALPSFDSLLGSRFRSCGISRLKLASQNFASWNRLDGWLRQLDALRLRRDAVRLRRLREGEPDYEFAGQHRVKTIRLPFGFPWIPAANQVRVLRRGVRRQRAVWPFAYDEQRVVLLDEYQRPLAGGCLALPSKRSANPLALTSQLRIEPRPHGRLRQTLTDP